MGRFTIQRSRITKQNLNHSEFFDKKITHKIKYINFRSWVSNGFCIRFYEKSGLIDLSNYTGVEVSKIGYSYCKKLS